MKIIIPMAGLGKRMRPHTLTTPKPLLPVAGKPIVQRLVEDIAAICQEKIEEIAFIIGDFGKETEERLLDIAKKEGVKGKIYYQTEPLGTGHAVLCAKDSLDGKTVVAFADTLFRADFRLDENKDGIIWVNKVDDPSAFGVVKTNENNIVTDFIEKPKTDVGTNLAIIGIYYFKNGKQLKSELQYLIDNDVCKEGEYQLTDALQNMMKKGTTFQTDVVTEWLDCGNKDATVFTNQRVLEINKAQSMISSSVKNINSNIIEPCFIGENVVIENSKIGPHVSIGDNTQIKDSVITNSIIQNNCNLSNVTFDNSMIGNHVACNGKLNDVSIGDYTVLK